MGLKKGFFNILKHVRCTVCGQVISIDLNETEKMEIVEHEKKILIEIPCPGCKHLIKIRIGKDKIEVE